MKIAIYSRKSVFTGKGESIENQIQLCKNYIKLNFPEVKEDDIFIYEDEGFSGSNINRPKFNDLLKDAYNENFNLLMCYKLDRISRNVSDFSSVIRILEEKKISFVSIKEQFDTTTPMGKAMMYISSVFAQLERDTIAERVKDNMYELAKHGRWLGGMPPYGFKSKKITYYDENMVQRKLYQLDVDDEKMTIVKDIYNKYMEARSITQVLDYLNCRKIRGARGGEMCTRNIALILRSPAYVKSSEEVINYLKENNYLVTGNPNGVNGILTYAKQSDNPIAAVANHEGIIDAKDWLFVQNILDQNREKAPRLGTGKVGLLTNILKCSKCGSNMTIAYKSNSDITYYNCSKKRRSGTKACDCKNIRCDKVEELIINTIKNTNFEELESYEYDNIDEINKSKETIKNNSQNINLQIKEKNNIIDSLVNQLGKYPDSYASDIIIKKIEDIKKEINTLEYELNKLNVEYSEIGKQVIDIKNLKTNITNFKKFFDNASLDQKRNMIADIVDTIDWFSDKEKFIVNYIGLKDNDSSNIKSQMYGYRRSYSYGR